MSGAATCSAPHREVLEVVLATRRDPGDVAGCVDAYELSLEDLDNVMRKGCLECLRFAHENHQTWPFWGDACVSAAKYGHWECVKYLHEYLHESGCPFNAASVTMLAVGNLEMLKYLREHGCPYDERVVVKAILDGDLESLKYLLDDWCLEEHVVTEALEDVMHPRFAFYAEPESCRFNVYKCLEYIHETRGYREDSVMSELRLRWAIKPIRLAMTTLDEVKECMTDGSYKTIADGLMHAYRNFNVAIDALVHS